MASNARAKNPQQRLEHALDLHREGRIAEAKAIYLQLLPFYRKNPDLLRLLGTAEYQLGNLDPAIALLDQSLAIDPQQEDAWNNRGNALVELKRNDAALESFDRALALKPDYVEAYSNRGNALRALRRFDEALENYDKAIAANPNVAEFHNNRGNVLSEINRIAEAMEEYDKALALQSSKMLDRHHAEAKLYYNRGNALRDLGQLEEALESYGRAIALDPNCAEAYSNRGIVLVDLQRFDEALADYERAIALHTNVPAEVYFHRGNALNGLQRTQEAAASFEKALAINPDHTAANNNRGNVLLELKQIDAAVASFDKALAHAPEFAEGYWNKSVVKLLNGEFEEGWRLYEWRWKTKQFSDKHKATERPLWLGEESIRGKTLLVYPEQGLGDFIQFARYTATLAAMGANVLLEVPVPLVSLVASMEGDFSILPAGGSLLPDFDYHCPIMSLPHACRTTVATIPAAIPYLYADPEKQAAWQQKLGTRTKPRVGIVWSGSAKHINDHNRSVPLALWQDLFAMGCEFHSLQKEIRAADAALLPTLSNLALHADELQDFSDTAALIAAMDLVISVDTSVAHLAGAMGKPVWILLPFAPDYRWMLHRADSPWYPTATLLRQPKAGDWASVIQEACERLVPRINPGDGPSI